MVSSRSVSRWCSPSRRWLVFGLSAGGFLTTANAAAADIYVAPSGNDGATGTLADPMRTIQEGVDRAGAGDTVTIRAGTYHEAVRINASGTAAEPIVVTGHPGERPLIDGEYTLPTGTIGGTDPQTSNSFVWTPLVWIRGDYVVVQNLEVARSWGRGIQIGTDNARQQHDEVRDCWVHDVRGVGIFIHEGDHQRIAECRTWHAGDYAPWVDGRSSSVNWPGAIATQRCSHVTIEGNEVFNTWGEGILPMASDHIRIAGNVVYDNFAVQIYSERTSYVTVEGNLAYHTNDPDFRRGGNPSTCIVFADELHDFAHTPQRTRNVTVLNNVVTGCRQNFAWWGASDGTNGLIESLVAHNTFVRAHSNDGDAVAMTVGEGTHTGCRFENNVIVQDEGVLFGGQPADVSFSHNLWTSSPPSHAASGHDLVADPALLHGADWTTLPPGDVAFDWFAIGPASPAVDQGNDLSGECDQDLMGTDRPQGAGWDMGAFEYFEPSGGAGGAGAAGGFGTGGSSIAGAGGTILAATPTDPSDDGGCGCRTTPARSHDAAWLLLLLLGAGLIRRRQARWRPRAQWPSRRTTSRTGASDFQRSPQPTPRQRDRPLLLGATSRARAQAPLRRARGADPNCGMSSRPSMAVQAGMALASKPQPPTWFELPASPGDHSWSGAVRVVAIKTSSCRSRQARRCHQPS